MPSLLSQAEEARLQKLLRIQLDDEVLFHGEVDVVPCGHSNDFALEGIFRVVQPLGHIDLDGVLAQQALELDRGTGNR